MAHANGELTSDDIYRYLLDGQLFLFVVRTPVIRAAAVCAVTQYARQRAVRVITLGGEGFDQWSPILNKRLLEWAKEMHADGIEAYVRKGMAVKLETLGYRQTYVGMWLDKEG